MKNRLLTLVAMMMIVSVFMTACGGSNNGGQATGNGNKEADTATNKQEDTKEPVKLVMWGAVPEEAGPKAVVDAWNAANPNIQVEYVRYVNDDAGNLKLDTALMTGQDVDLYVNYNMQLLEKRANAGTALDLGTFGDYDIAGKMGEFAGSWKIKDKFHALPTTANKNFIWLNKNALDEAGLEVPKEWTLEKLREYAKALTKEGRYGYVAYDWTMFHQMDGVLQGNYVKDGKSQLDNAAVKQSLQTYHDMMHVDKSMPALGEQLATKMDVSTMFLKGEAAMLGAGSWIFRSASNLKDFPRDFVVATAPIPSLAGQEANFAVEGGLGDGVSINAKSKHTKEAWEFLKWYADGGMLPLVAGGRVPASNIVDKQAAVSEMIKGVETLYDKPSIENTLFVERKQFQNAIEKKLADARKEEVEKYFLKDQNADQFVTNLVKRHNELLKP
ncbi:ABC transporter substrate-binding protein [Paenibacillus sp. GCM10023252]|uniref:ABC transporter substrate-binding protein n=1 Tax=Paenibacillus sp. GCM10023252 TaxID=3252649 RepID=UPI0036168AE6